MRLLAIDTAADACSVGVLHDDRLVVRSEIIGRRHAEVLMPMIAAAMAEAGLGFPDLDRIAATVGPGSFTGVRVGVAAARGLALATGVATVGIVTLAVHAEEARAGHPGRAVLAVLAAGRGDLYGALYAADGAVVVPPEAAPADRFAALGTAETVLAGSGADAVAALVDGTAPLIAERRAAVDMAALCRLAVLAPVPSGPPKPLYLRPPDAKPQAAARIARR